MQQRDKVPADEPVSADQQYHAPAQIAVGSCHTDMVRYRFVRRGEEGAAPAQSHRPFWPS